MRERENAYPFLRFVIAPSRSFSLWSRTLVELAQIRTREQARKGDANADRTWRKGRKGSTWTRLDLRAGYAYL